MTRFRDALERFRTAPCPVRVSAAHIRRQGELLLGPDDREREPRVLLTKSDEPEVYLTLAETTQLADCLKRIVRC